MLIYIDQSKLHYTLEDSNIQVKRNINMISRRLKLNSTKYIKEFQNFRRFMTMIQEEQDWWLIGTNQHKTGMFILE